MPIYELLARYRTQNYVMLTDLEHKPCLCLYIEEKARFQTNFEFLIWENITSTSVHYICKQTYMTGALFPSHCKLCILKVARSFTFIFCLTFRNILINHCKIVMEKLSLKNSTSNYISQPLVYRQTKHSMYMYMHKVQWYLFSSPKVRKRHFLNVYAMEKTLHFERHLFIYF